VDVGQKFDRAPTGAEGLQPPMTPGMCVYDLEDVMGN
jgi:hypothetical protein